mgnify:CR=1 FL=1
MAKYGERELRLELERIAMTGFTAPCDIDMDALTESMLEHIGSVDSVLRDDLIYRTFAAFISNNTLDASRVTEILEECLERDCMGYRIGEPDEDAVFRRSFSILLTALILKRNSREPFLDERTIRETHESLCRVYENERNVKGYYEGKGWAHTAAHTADAFEQLVMSEYIGTAEQERILRLISGKFRQHEYYFIDGEDERTAAVIGVVLEKNKGMKTGILNWIDGLVRYEKPKTNPEASIVKGNLRNLLRSVYFKCEDPEIRRFIEDRLTNLAFT